LFHWLLINWHTHRFEKIIACFQITFQSIQFTDEYMWTGWLLCSVGAKLLDSNYCPFSNQTGIQYIELTSFTKAVLCLYVRLGRDGTVCLEMQWLLAARGCVFRYCMVWYPTVPFLPDNIRQFYFQLPEHQRTINSGPG